MLKKLRASKHYPAVATSRHLKVAQSKHTGHLLPKASTSYPILAMLLLCVGIFIATWSSRVTADFTYPGPVTNSYSVTASVPGPPPSVAATIVAPTTGQSFNALPIGVSGECPVGTYESVTRNNVFSGVALCSQAGTYSLQMSLFKGANNIVVQDFSATNVPGPVSQSITVDYTPPVVVSPVGSSTVGSSTATSSSSQKESSTISPEPLLFKTKYSYQGYWVGQATNWDIDLEGGTPPYAVSVDWGDGTHNLFSRASPGAFDLSHTYKKTGGYKGSYVITLTASDANNQQTYLQLITIISNPPNVAGSTKGSGNKSGLLTNKITSTPTSTVERYVWSSYGVIVLMLFSFWLGERQEISKFRLKHKRVQHHR